MAEEFKAIQPLEYYRSFVKENLRPDGRSLLEFRQTELNINSISTADGSVLVKMGNTCVLCGIKAEFAEPTQDKPKEGFIVPNLELPPLCSPTFRPGPPSDQAQVCSQFLSDVIKSSKCINAEDLVIKAGKLVWCIYIDLTCLDYDGNVLDASVIAMSAALYNLSLPKVEFVDEEIKVNPAIKIPINMRNVPVATTFGIFDKIFLADPTNEEENLISERITIVTIDNDILCDIHKPGGTAISEEDLQDCIKRANKHFRNVLDLLKAAKNNDNR